MSGPPRFRPLAADEMDEAQRRVAAALSDSPRGEVRGPYVPLLYSPELADRMRHLGDFIRFDGRLPPRVKELLVLACARRWSVEYMFAVHRQFSVDAGLPASVADEIARGEIPSGLSAAEAAAYALCGDLLESADAGDAVFESARAHFGEAGVVELVCFVGYYTALSMLLNCARVPVPEGAVGLATGSD